MGSEPVIRRFGEIGTASALVAETPGVSRWRSAGILPKALPQRDIMD
jgi:hypothetical protein